jgi:hypothetical protein
MSGGMNRRQEDKKEGAESEPKFASCPRYDKHELSDEQISQIAEAAAQKAVQIARDNFYKDVGKSVVSKWFVIIGMGTVAAYAWARNKGIF